MARQRLRTTRQRSTRAAKRRRHDPTAPSVAGVAGGPGTGCRRGCRPPTLATKVEVSSSRYGTEGPFFRERLKDVGLDRSFGPFLPLPEKGRHRRGGFPTSLPFQRPYLTLNGHKHTRGRRGLTLRRPDLTFEKTGLTRPRAWEGLRQALPDFDPSCCAALLQNVTLGASRSRSCG